MPVPTINYLFKQFMVITCQYDLLKLTSILSYIVACRQLQLTSLPFPPVSQNCHAGGSSGWNDVHAHQVTDLLELHSCVTSAHTVWYAMCMQHYMCKDKLYIMHTKALYMFLQHVSIRGSRCLENEFRI